MCPADSPIADHLAVRPTSGSTTDQLRRNNLSKILTLIHREGALSRADLTRLTSLNRSTVGAIAAELAALGFVDERPPLDFRAGRPSPVVHPNERTVAVAVNPEVDAVHVGIVALGGVVLARSSVGIGPEASASEVVRIAAAEAHALLAELPGHRVFGAGIAVPGQVRIGDGQVREASHMGWFEEPVAAMFEAATGFPTFAANAAILAMRAESVFGAGKGVDNFVYVIGGASGIGGGMVSGGKIVTGAAGYAGEIGHTFVRSSGASCFCGAHGCLEAEVTQARLLQLVNLPPSQIAELGPALAASTEPAVRAAVAEDVALVAIAIRNAVNLFNPSVVVLAGFLAALMEGSGDDASAILPAEAVLAARESVRVERARFGADQLLIGAAELVFAGVLGDPSGYASSRA
ncbi:putative NBD/HSP70 family sugar kinase [Glaciihabitans tibetensis]|uniref:Putative NBD/HSP70 family sugar kinase n=1 Tax=Glaciihabitans tibetensis TaxID=1266600 RepID=A0A2T0V7B4_9MICO|nr:ROK family transcriptional regulator [Glaciihabitans tibetensis]PRY65948.1 putative NBD/HSP70 family sugar kinase [Glaciihabitans tibetensis]